MLIVCPKKDKFKLAIAIPVNGQKWRKFTAIAGTSFCKQKKFQCINKVFRLPQNKTMSKIIRVIF